MTNTKRTPKILDTHENGQQRHGTPICSAQCGMAWVSGLACLNDGQAWL